MEPEHIKAFKTLKGALLQAPALSLPTEKEFNLFATERGGIALGGVTQKNGPIQQPVTYLSKELDMVSRGWPHCLQVIAAVALLVPEAIKITLGRDLIVYTSHDLSGIPMISHSLSKGGLWLSDSRLLKYQALLLEGPITQIRTCSTLNPATFLPETLEESPEHDCQQVLAMNYSA